MKICFTTNQIDVRGTCVAMYDYADYAERLLGHNVIIASQKGVDELAVDKFMARFGCIYYYNSQSELENILESLRCDMVYCIKYGRRMDSVNVTSMPMVVHCVFDMSEPHGVIYAGVSKSLACKYGYELYVPHMISLIPSITRENMREALKIPMDATVFGRYGGVDTFNLEFTEHVISRLLTERNDMFFVFLNTPMFYIHPHIFYFDKIVSDREKNMFIHTCDAMIVPERLGHTFGLACGEFSVNKKPCIVYNGDELWNRAHIENLGSDGIYFKTSDELYDVLNNFVRTKDYSFIKAYSEFTPFKVMSIFDRVFLEGVKGVFTDNK